MPNDLTPTYIPEQFNLTPEEAVARANEIRAERKNKLSPIQGLFVNHFFEANMDLSLAASRAGVSVKQAKDWIDDETGPVSELIARKLEEISKRTNVTVDSIVEALWNEANRMPVDSEDKTVSHAARVSALSHLAKFKGMFEKGAKNNGVKVTLNIDTGRGQAIIHGGEIEHE